MSEQPPQNAQPDPEPQALAKPVRVTKRRRWWLRLLVAFVVLGIVVAGVAISILRSAWFHEYLRARIVQQAERATGGRVEIADFHFDWTGLQASVDGFVLHGNEAADVPPLIQIPSATLSFHIISMMERSVDLAGLHIDQPRINVIIYPDGSNNLPEPATHGDHKVWSEDLLNLKVREYDVSNGWLDYDNRHVAVNIHGEHLRVRMAFDPKTPAYRGELASDQVRVAAPHFGPASSDDRAPLPEPFTGSITTDFALERDQLSFQHLQLKTTDGTEALLSGTLQNLRVPQGTLKLHASTPMREVVRRFNLPLEPVGSATLNGTLKLVLGDPFDFAVNGRLAASGMKYTNGKLSITGARLDGDAEITREGFSLRHLTTRILDADITGDAHLDHWKDLHVTGTLAGMTLQRAGEMLADTQAGTGQQLPSTLPWSGVMAGTFSVDSTVGVLNAMTRANLTIVPLPVGNAPVPGVPTRPIQGHLDIVFNQAEGTIALGSSSVETAATRVELSGTLGRELRMRARSTDLNDIVPVIDLLKAANTKTELPLQLNNGAVTVDGTVSGSLDDPHFAGQFAATNGVVEGFAFDRFSAELSATQKEVSARNITAIRGSTEVTGTAGLTARPAPANAGALGEFSDAEITGQFSARNLRIPELAQELGVSTQNSNLAGTASAQVHISGSVQHPQVSASLDVANPAGYGETLDRLTANVRYLPGELDVTDGIGTDRGSRLLFSGGYRHPASDWKSGEINIEASTDNLPSARIDHLANVPLAFTSTFAGRVQAAGKLQGGVFSLTSATADVTARTLRVDNLAIGDFKILAQTQGTTLTASADGNVLESQVKANGTWKLQGDEAGSATLHFTRLTAASANTLAMIGVPLDRRTNSLPVQGFVEGGATVSLSLQNPAAFRATVTLDNMQLNGKPDQALSLGVQPGDLILKNTQPVVFDVTMDEARLRSAQFTGRDTNLTASGTIPFRNGVGADLNVRGNVNLIILQLVDADLLAQGNATVDVAIRGNLQDPVINGRLTLADASFFMKDYPNGVEKAQGSILFDRRRATVERLTARTGEGTVTFTGFVEFGSSPVFRLQAAVDRVRVRYPQDVSMTFSGNLAFTGTADASTLIGSITMNRASFSPRADLGQIMAEMSQSSSGPESTNSFLRGLQLDIKIDSAPGFQLETSLTRDLESVIKLHLRGSPLRPGLQGTLSVERGEVQVFGNKYTVDRGEIRFLNPAKIEPTFDMNLSTRARGVTVNVSFVGTMAHLNPNYSSDPPLQTSEIFSLLAVGRDPTTTSNQLAPGPATGSAGNSMVETGGSILGQALSNQFSSKYQRFFGSSHVRIDPTLTGVDNLPQARLQLDQQVSKDITLTYITNLNRSTEQIVRVQWDISREWSAIAVRDQNGLFGIDFQFRKRFD
ncbi:MAG: translocation/assembly module TamB domain-containing protein [Acidobacteriota bacterium]